MKYTLATKLVNELCEAGDDKGLAKTIARYGRVDLLLRDELLSQESAGGGVVSLSRGRVTDFRHDRPDSPWTSALQREIG